MLVGPYFKLSLALCLCKRKLLKETNLALAIPLLLEFLLWHTLCTQLNRKVAVSCDSSYNYVLCVYVFLIYGSIIKASSM